MAHDEPDEHGAAMKEFLSGWTPLTMDDRAKAFDDGPAVVFIDGDEYASRATAHVNVSMDSDDADVFNLTLGAIRNASTVFIERGGDVVHTFRTPTEAVGETISLERYNDPEAYMVGVKDEATDEIRATATVGVERNPRQQPLPDGRSYGAVVTHGGSMEEEFGRKVVAKYRHDAVKSWTHARYIVVADATRREAVSDDVLHNPTDQEYDLWFNGFYTDYRDIGWSVLEDVLWPEHYSPQNKPYSVICVS